MHENVRESYLVPPPPFPLSLSFPVFLSHKHTHTISINEMQLWSYVSKKPVQPVCSQAYYIANFLFS